MQSHIFSSTFVTKDTFTKFTSQNEPIHLLSIFPNKNSLFKLESKEEYCVYDYQKKNSHYFSTGLNKTIACIPTCENQLLLITQTPKDNSTVKLSWIDPLEIKPDAEPQLIDTTNATNLKVAQDKKDIEVTVLPGGQFAVLPQPSSTIIIDLKNKQCKSIETSYDKIHALSRSQFLIENKDKSLSLFTINVLNENWGKFTLLTEFKKLIKGKINTISASPNGKYIAIDSYNLFEKRQSNYSSESDMASGSSHITVCKVSGTDLKYGHILYHEAMTHYEFDIYNRGRYSKIDPLWATDSSCVVILSDGFHSALENDINFTALQIKNNTVTKKNIIDKTPITITNSSTQSTITKKPTTIISSDFTLDTLTLSAYINNPAATVNYHYTFPSMTNKLDAIRAKHNDSIDSALETALPKDLTKLITEYAAITNTQFDHDLNHLERKETPNVTISTRLPNDVAKQLQDRINELEFYDREKLINTKEFNDGEKEALHFLNTLLIISSEKTFSECVKDTTNQYPKLVCSFNTGFFSSEYTTVGKLFNAVTNAQEQKLSSSSSSSSSSSISSLSNDDNSFTSSFIKKR